MASIIYCNLDDKKLMLEFIKRHPTVVAMNETTKKRLALRINLLEDRHDEILDFFKVVYIDVNNKLGDDIIAGIEWA